MGETEFRAKAQNTGEHSRQVITVGREVIKKIAVVLNVQLTFRAH